MGSFSFVLWIAVLLTTCICSNNPQPPKRYDGTFSLRVEHTSRRYEGWWRWGNWGAPHTLTANWTKVIMRDEEKEMYQEIHPDGEIIVQKKNDDEKFQTYIIGKSKGECKIEKSEYEMKLNTGSLSFPTATSQEQSRTKTGGGKVKITFEEDFYDLSGEYHDKWVTVYDTETHSYLPVSHRFIFDMQNEGPDDSFSDVEKTSYAPVEAEWAVVPDNCA